MKNEKRKENKVKTNIVLTLLLVTCYLLFGCDNDFDMPQGVPAAGEGYGRVTVTINGATARTVFPTMTFAKYEYFFAKVINGEPGTPQTQAPVDGYFTLELGDWQLTVKAYVKAGDTVPAATGSSAIFTVTGSGVAQAAVLLSGNAETGEGKFVYTITYPAGATISAFSLKNFQNNAVIDINVSGASPLSGSVSVISGYYFLTIQLTESGGARTTGANEVVYIYDKLDSEYSKDFSADDFSHVHDWNESYITIATATERENGIESITCKHNSSHFKEPRFNGAYATGTAGLDFMLINDNTAYRVYNTDTSNGTADGAIFIPAYRLYNGNYLPVMEIGNGSYSSSNAFGGTSSSNPNTTVTFAAESQLTTISDYAFANCSRLASVTIPNSVTTIGSYAFEYCYGLTSVTIPNSVTSIGAGAFIDCTGLTSVTIGEGVTSIDSQAFYGCTGLTSVTIPNSVTSIGGGAFYGCTGLTSVTIPNSVTSIGAGAFSSCTGLTSITVDANNPNYASQNGILYNKAKTSILSVPARISGSVTIPNSVTTIGISAFAGCSRLTSVTIPNSVTTIGISAFAGCSRLTSVTIPDSVTSIGSGAFRDCTGLTSVTIPNSVTTIGSYAFEYCYGLTSVTIGEGVTSIGQDAFSRCTSLTSITIPASVSSMPYAFSYCTYLRNIIIDTDKVSTESSVNWGTMFTATNLSVTFKKNVGNRAFYNCSRLTSVTIAEGVTSIDSQAFYNCTGLTSVTIPASVTSIGYSAFYNTEWFNNLPDGLVYVNKILYRYKGTMPANTIINNIRTDTIAIAGNAFYNCTGLTSVTIPNSVTTIGSYAFEDCTGLTSVTIPASVTSVCFS